MGSRILKIVTVTAALSVSALPAFAQTETRIIMLEEQVRQLTGKIEELNFQLLQIQEQMRRTQEDNDLRFQELEEKRSDAGSGDSTFARRQDDPVADEINRKHSRVLGEPPRNLGTLTLDNEGNVVGGELSDPDNLLGGNNSGEVPRDETAVAALPSSAEAGELYQNAYEFILSGDYGTAEASFRDHIERFPDDPQTADARYWLGEALLGQNRNREAAETFLSASQNYPTSKKAPDMMLKLGVALVSLDQKQVACATFREAESRYQNVSPAFKQRLTREMQAASC